MGEIKGIRVDITTGSDWWSPTSDALFLGVYGEEGGREFRLNGNVEISQVKKEFFLVLGDACCETPKDIQVQYSTNFGDNDPLLNPIELGSVRYVYLRKETEDSTFVNDDVLTIGLATVLLCDRDGNLRRWRKRGEIDFSDEVGLQHWLGPIAPPMCEITVILRLIKHNDEAKFPAGKNWYLDFGAGPTLEKYNILNGYHHKVNDDDEWKHEPEGAHTTFTIPGCCGTPRDVAIYGGALERDWTTKDDHSWGTNGHSVPCTQQETTQSYSLSFVVQGHAKKFASRITYEYDIRSVCRP